MTPDLFRRGFVGCALLSAATLGGPRSASAADPGRGKESLHVVRLVERGAPAQARAMTAALKARVLALPDYALGNSDLSFEPLAARCHKGPLFPAAGPAAGEPAPSCLAQIGAFLQERRFAQKSPFLWGVVYRPEGGGERVALRLHLWREGAPDALVDLSYAASLGDPSDPALGDVAEWALLRLVRGEGKVARVRVRAPGAAEGSLYVDGAPRGELAAGGERALVLEPGAHAFELRQGEAVRASAQRSVGGGDDAELELAPVKPPPAARALPPLDLGVTPTPTGQTSALPWVFGGVGALGLVGAGVFLALRQGANSDLEKACRDGTCPRPQQDTLDRGNLYGTLSLGSLGVGLVGAGLATYFALDAASSRSATATGPRWVATVQPLAGGAAAGLSGRF
jgi:hypothetical protein